MRWRPTTGAPPVALAALPGAALSAHTAPPRGPARRTANTRRSGASRAVWVRAARSEADSRQRGRVAPPRRSRRWRRNPSPKPPERRSQARTALNLPRTPNPPRAQNPPAAAPPKAWPPKAAWPPRKRVSATKAPRSPRKGLAKAENLRPADWNRSRATKARKAAGRIPGQLSRNRRRRFASSRPRASGTSHWPPTLSSTPIRARS